ncbi:conserved hypothetical protein [Rippkaea orientalis PCC 8801]|uniref:DM13 domain-containing protein n=1 Tax=Rippkaea orientalis (strain PCC 8801 / RF-1) TaxID=41431 RepID=B7JY08_RIPO1|nr:DM13 domain-containing protein [Rippkaea orientalis]ACK65972.1 conserved hypothetical protein [Rippkaea orientalis PCC 8801]
MKVNLLTTATTTVLLMGTLSTCLVQSNAVLANRSDSNTNPQSQLIASNIVLSGMFVTTEQDHPTKGKATIISEGGKNYLQFDSAFDTADGPDVQVILHRNNTVPVNLSEKDYIILAPLKNRRGTQRYEIPNTIKVNDFKSVAIWCREFNVTFGYAAF